MDIFVYKFNPDAEDRSQAWISEMIERIDHELLNSPAGSFSQQFWDRGHIDSLGYRFTPNDVKYVLVTKTNEDGNEWYEHAIPGTDKDLVRKYVIEYFGDDCAFIILDDSVNIHTT